MDINLTIDNFLDTLLGDVVKKVNGIDETVPGIEKTNLGMCFYQSLKNKVFPAEFEANISKGFIKINSLDKPELTKFIGDDAWKDGWFTSAFGFVVFVIQTIFDKISELRELYNNRTKK